MEVSIFLAKAIGLASVISTLAVILNYKKSVTFEIELAKNPATVYASGFIFLIIGVLIIVGHPVFEFSWRILITLMGWAFLIKGIGRVLFPESVGRMIEKKQKNSWFIMGEVIVFLAGLYLLYYGFIIY